MPDNNDEQTSVYEIPEYGRKWGLSKNGSYAAAHSGVWPVVWINKRGYIPKVAGDRLLAEGFPPPFVPRNSVAS
jgi:hypothetical protein